MKNLNRFNLILSIICFFTLPKLNYAQISITNPDLEAPGCASCIACTPTDWFICAATSPDTQPGEFGVFTPPKSGCTYVGMVHQEYISQQLACPFIANKTYALTVWLAFNPYYGNAWGPPGQLDVYGGTSGCTMTELFWSSGVLPVGANQNWIEYTISFTPTATYDFITFQNPFPMTNILIDNISQTIATVVPTLNIAKGTLDCGNDTDGEATVSVTGTYTYNFQWSNGQLDVGVTSSTNVNLPVGNNTVTIIDPLDQCVAPTVVDVIINAPADIELDIVKVDESCLDSKDGTAQVNIVSGGVAPFTYLWDDVAASTTANIASLSEGYYTVIVTDANNCSFSASTTIDLASPAFDAGLDNTVSVCNTNDQVDLFSSLGGTPDVGGVWTDDDGTGKLSVDQFNATGLVGDYHFTYTIGEDPCFYSATVTVSVLEQLTAGVGYSEVLCELNKGFNLFNNLTGSPSIDGVWEDDPINSGGLAGNVFDASAVGAGIYNLKYVVTPDLPCEPVEALVTIEVIKQPDAGLSNTVSVCNSVISVDLFSNLLGTPDLNGTWNDDDATGRLNNGVFNPNGLSAGQYDFTFLLPDDLPCFGVSSVVTVVVDEQKDAGTNNSLEICNDPGSFNLFDQLLGSPDVGGLWFYVDGGNSPFSGVFNPAIHNSGLYEYVIDGGVNCATVTSTMDVIVNDKPNIDKVTDTNCDANGLNYQVTIEVSAGDPGTYTVDGVLIGGATFISNWIPSGTAYSFNIDDAKACGPVLVSGAYACDCKTKAGIMDLAKLDVCVNSMAEGEHDASTLNLDPNDHLIFVLHTSPNTILGNILDINLTEPDFAFDANNLSVETIYYISAVAGDGLTDGTVDLNDLCLDITPGTPVVFHELPQASMGNGGLICAGDAFDLTIQFLAGNAPYDAIINDGVIDKPYNGLNNGDLINVTPNQTTYYKLIQVSDKYGCISEPIITNDITVVTVNPLPDATFTGVSTTFCEGNMPAIFVVNIFDGAPNFDVTIFDPELGTDRVIQNKGLGDLIIQSSNNLSVGTHQYTLKSISDVSSAGCTSVFNEDLIVTVNENPSMTLTGDATICLNESAELTFDFTKGLAPFSVNFIEPNNQPLLNIATSPFKKMVTPVNIGINEYEVTLVSDANGCFVIYDAGDEKVTITVHDLPQVNITQSSTVYCENTNFTDFTFNFLSGQGPFEIDYKIDNNPIVTLTGLDATNNTWRFPNTTPGVYLISFEAIRGVHCANTLSEQRGIKIMNNPTGEITGDQFICHGQNANVQFKFGGGEFEEAWNFKYQINNDPVISRYSAFPDLNLSLPNLANSATVRLLEVTTSTNGCKVSYADKKAEIIVNPEAQIKLSGDNTICYGDETTLKIKVLQGNGPFSLQFNDATLNGDYIDGDEITVSPIISSNIQITQVLDNALCLGTVVGDGADIQVIELPTVSFGPDAKICKGDQAALTIDFENGVGTDYDIVLNGNPIMIQDGYVVEVQPSGNQVYSITQITDGSGFGCTNYEEYFAFVEVIELPQAVMENDFAICDKEEAIIPIQLNGIAPFTITYEDSDNGSFDLTNVNNDVAILVSPSVGQTTYQMKSVQMESFPFCSAKPEGLIGSSMVTVHPLPDVKFSVFDVTGCTPIEPTFVNETDPMFLGKSFWDFDLGYQKEINDISFTETFHLPKTYEVTLTVESPFGCIGQQTNLEKIIAYPFPNADFRYFPDPIIVGNADVVTYVNRTTGGSVFEWLFHKADDENKNVALFDVENPKQQTPIEAGEYVMELTATSEFGCVDKVVKRVEVIGEIKVNIPNSFTPDGDGLNDTFQPVIKDGLAEGYSFSIFDRWGELMFMSNDITATSWDGTFNGKHVESGNYVYHLAVKSKYTEKIEEHEGSILLMR